MTPAPTRPLVVFTDLDGTLLDHHTYSWRAAAPALDRLRGAGIPLVLVSSKTREEMESLRRDLGLHTPFVVENGAAVYVPEGYFDGESGGEAEPGFEVEILGRPRPEILEALHDIRRRRGFRFEGFADWDVDQIRHHTGLDAAAARAAARRDGTEPLLWFDDAPADELAAELERHDLCLVRGGRFLHAMGRSDKGRAVRRLLERWREMAGPVASMALGDSENDLGMLRAVDRPVLVPRAVGAPLDPGALPGLRRAPAPGPEGWCRAVDPVLDELGF